MKRRSFLGFPEVASLRVASSCRDDHRDSTRDARGAAPEPAVSPGPSSGGREGGGGRRFRGAEVQRFRGSEVQRRGSGRFLRRGEPTKRPAMGCLNSTPATHAPRAAAGRGQVSADPPPISPAVTSHPPSGPARPDGAPCCLQGRPDPPPARVPPELRPGAETISIGSSASTRNPASLAARAGGRPGEPPGHHPQRPLAWGRRDPGNPFTAARRPPSASRPPQPPAPPTGRQFQRATSKRVSSRRLGLGELHSLFHPLCGNFCL